MTFNLDPNKPIYQQVAQQILQDIKEGKLRPGDRLPTERELAAQLGVAGHGEKGLSGTGRQQPGGSHPGQRYLCPFPPPGGGRGEAEAGHGPSGGDRRPGWICGAFRRRRA